jgi:hypothetical protein
MYVKKKVEYEKILHYRSVKGRIAFMFSPRDFLLLAVSFGSLLVGILAPGACAPLQPYPVVFMMLLLFLSFHELHPGHRLQRPVLFPDRAHGGRPVYLPLLRPGDPRARLAQLEVKDQTVNIVASGSVRQIDRIREKMQRKHRLCCAPLVCCLN